ncbi:glucose-6-phosphate dehydrogenase [Microbacterium sp. NPDC089189]|uniref:glucose-6-phosphate dehydrogenase n=1 Tax=Microbacterium sp. NPDC089189 TaxID=3154972 RepID=UPI0034387442
MKIASSADWRENIPFETPLLVSELAPGEPGRCAGCGAASAPLPRTELWAVKHRHPNDHSGFVRFYCAEHKPEPKPVAVVAPTPATRATPARKKATAPRQPSTKPSIPERARAVCPDCFVEANANGVCGMCGEKVG